MLYEQIKNNAEVRALIAKGNAKIEGGLRGLV